MIKMIIYIGIAYIAYIMVKESKIFSSLRGKSIREKESYKNLDISDADYEDIKEDEK
ncbi:MAG: hypothetical protein VX932_03525 [Candidatus Neomarinimicrobiota bacterium]|nr:hypothetical protein [Candidatus Neomarinimicrobiota bacterium]MEC9448328.1 hypothetical protein [Candidatus Neomarinimicrobiota bacterium]|tara:strand:+ start:1332 stop:1502 length:171 start_codon:yes stop_codon:yes gene_type:complete